MINVDLGVTKKTLRFEISFAVGIDRIILRLNPSISVTMGINVLKIDRFPKMAYEEANDFENAVYPKLLVGFPKTRYFLKACEV